MGLFDFTGATIDKMVIHKVGNKAENEGMIIARDLYTLQNGKLEEVLLKYLLSPFKNNSILYTFYHETNLHLNEIYTYTSNIFLNSNSFYQESINIVKHLYEKSDHPKIKSGEVYLIYFKNCVVEDTLTDAIGIFKSENKDIYLKVEEQQRDFKLNCEKGINIKKLDKGCLIFHHDLMGYKVSIVDAVKKDGDEALYWKEEFLKVKEIQDDSFLTKTYLNLCKNYCEDVYTTLHKADKKEQATFINKTLNYFSNNNEFDLEKFSQEVIVDPKTIETFKNYKEDYEEMNEFMIKDSFYISDDTVKSMKKNFKNLIKLDTEIEIKIKNTAGEIDNTEFIEKGYDEVKGMYYYKIYFNEEK